MSTTVFQLFDLDGGNGFAVNGIHEADGSTFSVSSARNVNRDGPSMT